MASEKKVGVHTEQMRKQLEREEARKQHFRLIGNGLDHLQEALDNIESIDDAYWLLTHAIKEGNLPIVKALMTFKDLKIVPMRPTGHTPVHVAFFQEQWLTLEYLLTLVGKTNYADENGLTVLHIACSVGNEDAVWKILDTGVDPNCVHRSNKLLDKKPLTIAQRGSRKRICDMLVALKATGEDGVAPVAPVADEPGAEEPGSQTELLDDDLDDDEDQFEVWTDSDSFSSTEAHNRSLVKFTSSAVYMMRSYSEYIELRNSIRRTGAVEFSKAFPHIKAKRPKKEHVQATTDLQYLQRDRFIVIFYDSIIIKLIKVNLSLCPTCLIDFVHIRKVKSFSDFHIYQKVKKEPNDTLTNADEGYVLDLVDICKVENFESWSFKLKQISILSQTKDSLGKDEEIFKHVTELVKLHQYCSRLRMLGGSESPEDRFQYQAYLKNILKVKYDGFYCGASIIDKRFALTAAHCLDGYVQISILYT
ncbi:unnamed protein product [Trichogramma brassicae]|uniref:Peptidase S1 domain-containing protein n=1 Tax=Trichogramma brassicae TaxID=86971 RepID=A0A6H5I7J6_9HYME|nr:unnamed protein product [Trichogramma brassicae]